MIKRIDLVALLTLVPLLGQAQEIDFKQIIKESAKGQVYEIKDSATQRTSILTYLGDVTIGDTTLYLINHVYHFPTASGTVHKNQRMWVLTEAKSLGYYMIVEMDNKLPFALIGNKYLVFEEINIDFTERFRKCLQLDRTFCFTDWEFEFDEGASDTWSKWPNK